MTYRNRELLNLIVVGALTAIGFASVYIARQEVVSTSSLSYAGFFFTLYLAAHIVARVCVPFADPYLLPMAALLTAVGVTEIYRLNPDDAFRQGLWVVIGVALLSATLFLLRRDYRRLETYRYLFGLSALILLVLPAMPGIGRTINGANLWVGIGPLQLQPGELAKIMLIVFLAGYLREKREVLAQGRLKDFGPLLVIWGGAMLVLFQTNDLGSGLLYFGIFLAMLYVATARGWFVAAGAVLFVVGASALYQIVTRVQERVSVWWDPWPLAQELGLVGSAALLLVFMLFVLRGFRVALLATDGFSKLLAVGLTFGFALQTFIIVGGVLRLIPLTGITLPFVSYGGSSLLANFLMLAGLLLISNRANARLGK